MVLFKSAYYSAMVQHDIIARLFASFVDKMARQSALFIEILRSGATHRIAYVTNAPPNSRYAACFPDVDRIVRDD